MLHLSPRSRVVTAHGHEAWAAAAAGLVPWRHPQGSAAYHDAGDTDDCQAQPRGLLLGASNKQAASEHHKHHDTTAERTAQALPATGCQGKEASQRAPARRGGGRISRHAPFGVCTGAGQRRQQQQRRHRCLSSQRAMGRPDAADARAVR
jgi:hypothetical protein